MPLTSDSFALLNPEQRAAVEHGEGPLLVVAGAGTGKTRVITERIRYLLETNSELAGENILGLTFTNKAAGEMKHRVVKAVGERAEGVWLSTFHEFCLEKILREARPDIQVLDDTDHWILLRRHMADLGLVHYKKLSEPGQFLTDFVKFFSRCQDELVTPDDYDGYVASLRKEFNREKKKLDAGVRLDREEEIAEQEEVARVYRVSERLLRERNLVTFGEQLLESVAILRGDPERLRRMREQYRYVLVDEFQDTNIAQLELLWLLAGEHRNIVAVGDDDQAIYRFRGASFGSFTIFLDRFCEGHSSNRRPLAPLTQNYRSTQRILRVAGQVISNNEKSPLLPPKQLTTENPDGEKIRIVEFATPEEEAHWIAGEIERQHGPGHPWRSFAVLYRKHRHRNRLIEALRQRQIPFVIKKLSILTSTLVRDLIAYLRLIAVPGDSVSCARVLAIPYWGFEPRDLVRLAERAGRAKGESLWDQLEKMSDEPPSKKNTARAGELAAFVRKLRERAKRLPVTGLLDELIAELGLAPLPSDADRLTLARFVEFVSAWEKKSDGKSLKDFIQYLEFFLEANAEITLEEEPADDAVQLMTVHAAKGLEFLNVFVMQLANGDFPARPQPAVFEFPEALMKEEKPKGDFRIQEERRLFYVALTRARRHLTLTAVLNQRKKPSPFLDDILQDPRTKRVDALQLAPKVAVPRSEDAAGSPPADASQPQLFGSAAATTRAYSQVALWAKAYHPPQPEPLQLSASAIDTYEMCPMKYQFQQTWGLRGGPAAAMTFGNVMHATIHEFIAELRKRRPISFADVEAIFNREWPAASFRDSFQEEEYRKAGREQLEAFYRTASAAPPDVLEQERTFELPLEPNVLVIGRIDQINKLGPHAVEIVDYKTGNPKDQKGAEKSLQLGLYAMAARDVLGLDPERLVFYNLTTNEAVATTRDKKALDQAAGKVAEVADRIRAADFPAKPGFICRYCDFKPLCPAHEQLVSIRITPGSGYSLSS
jgi:ATP-dependent DNA helicase UvrD/PcrA